MPWAVQRTSYQLMNDSSHLLSLRRMLHYRTTYLAYFDMGGPIIKATHEMVKELPRLFTEIGHLKVPRAASAAVYEVDLDAVAAYLEKNGGGGEGPDGVAVPLGSPTTRGS